MIRSARIERVITNADVAERAGISRGLALRIEKCEMGSAIGEAFEVAAILGLCLLEAETTTQARHLRGNRIDRSRTQLVRLALLSE